jgi:hypothetical protein
MGVIYIPFQGAAGPAGLTPGTNNVAPGANSGYIDSFSSVDGGGSYAEARSGTGVSTLTANTAVLIVGQSAILPFEGTDQDYSCQEGMLEFDTLIASGTLSTATLKLHVFADNSDTDFTINVYAYDYGTSLTTADWVGGGSIPPGGASLACSLSTSGIGTGLKTLTNSGTVLKDAVNISGKTRLIVTSSRHSGFSAPANDTFEQLGITLASCILELVIV